MCFRGLLGMRDEYALGNRRRSCVPLAVRTAFAIFRLLVQRWWRRRSGTPYRGAAQYARSAFCAAQKRVAQSAIRHVAHRACASHCHARARCAGHAHEHMHACRERLTRTLHARERRRCGNHFTWQHALTSNGKLRSAHWPLADRRPACRWHIWREHALQSRSPPPVLARHMHHPHDVPAINHRLIV